MKIKRNSEMVTEGKCEVIKDWIKCEEKISAAVWLQQPDWAGRHNHLSAVELAEYLVALVMFSREISKRETFQDSWILSWQMCVVTAQKISDIMWKL